MAPTLASLSSPAFQALVEAAKPSYFAKHEALCAMGVTQTDQLEVRNLEQIVRFTGRAGGIEARAQMWGSYQNASETWEWAWNHPDIPDVWKQESCAVLRYGATHGLAPLTTGIIECTFAEAWQLVIAAAHIVDAEAAYGGPSTTRSSRSASATSERSNRLPDAIARQTVPDVARLRNQAK